jgi:hypothetical protein
VLRESTHLHEYLQTVNTLRIDYDGLSQHIRQLLNESNIGILKQAGDEYVNRQIIEKIIPSASLLPYNYVAAIVALMNQVAGNDQIILQEIRLFERQQRRKKTWQKFKTPLVIVVTILLCWIIYRINR